MTVCHIPHSGGTIDVSQRYNHLTYRCRCEEVTRVRVRAARPAARGAHARLRAAQALARPARSVSRVLLRIAVPNTAATPTGGPDRGGRAGGVGTFLGTSGAQGLQADT